MRFTARARATASPQTLWRRLEDVRGWGPLLQGPDQNVPVLRVKRLDGEPTIEEGATLQLLFEDKSWTTFRIAKVRPGKQLDLEAESWGHGETDTGPVKPRRAERIVLIPQGGGAEVECSVVLDVGVMGRVLGPMMLDRSGWEAAVAARVAWLTGGTPDAITVETLSR